MSAEWGGGDECIVGGYAIGADAAALDRISGGPSPLEIPGITLSAQRRIGGRRDGGIEASFWHNVAALQQHEALKSLPTADRVVSYLRGQALGNPAASVVAKQINYDWERGDDGSLAGKVQALANAYGLEWGRLLTAGVRTDTGATNGASIDTAASLSFGAQAYLHVGAFTGTDVTVKIQDSANDSTFADVTGLAFAQVTGGAPLAERVATASGATVRRYLRAVTVTTGGFSSAALTVIVVKNETAVVF